MQLRQFKNEVNRLRDTLMTTIKAHFEGQGLPFSEENFTEESSIDLEDVARDAYFFGAGTFPEIEPYQGIERRD